MKIKLNENKIVAYVIVGNLKGGIEVDNSILPDDFMMNFKSNYYVYNDNQISINPDYKYPEMETSNITPSQNQKLFMNLSQNVATLQSMIMTQNQQIAQLMAKEAKQYDDTNANAAYFLGYVG